LSAGRHVYLLFAHLLLEKPFTEARLTGGHADRSLAFKRKIRTLTDNLTAALRLFTGEALGEYRDFTKDFALSLRSFGRPRRYEERSRAPNFRGAIPQKKPAEPR